MYAIAPRFGLINREMNRLFTEANGNQTQAKTNLVPRVNISEDKENIYIHAELPGIPQDAVKITVKDGTLSLRGEKKKEEKHEDRNYFRIERRYGEFVRSFTLPENVKEDAITAKFEHGVLEIVLPKSEPEKAAEREIKINVNLN